MITSRSGKTVCAMRFIASLAQVKRKNTGKKLRIVCLDPKNDWRGLAKWVDPERFRFFSLGNAYFHPLKLNAWKVPRGVNLQLWIDSVIDIYCRAYGLLERGKQMIADVVYELYAESGVFDTFQKVEGWEELIPELSSRVSFQAIFKRMEEKRDVLCGGNKSGKDTMDAFARLLERLSAFDREYSVEYLLFGTGEGIGIDEMVGEDDVTVIESQGLEKGKSYFALNGALIKGRKNMDKT